MRIQQIQSTIQHHNCITHRIMRPHALRHAPDPKGFPQMQDTQIGKIGHPGHCFQDIKASKVPFGPRHGIQEANDAVDRVNEDLVDGVNAEVHALGDWSVS